MRAVGRQNDTRITSVQVLDTGHSVPLIYTRE